MRGKIGLVLLAVGLFATVANAGVFYDPTDTTGKMTLNGWSQDASTQADLDSGKAMDVSYSESAAGTNGIWHVADTNQGPVGNTYFYGYKNDAGAIDQTRGIITARINVFNAGSNGGTFGYSSAEGNHGVMLSLRNGGIALKSANGAGTGTALTVADMQNQYRVYAMAYTYNPTTLAYALRVWISNGDDFSNQASGWTELTSALAATNLAGYNGPLKHFGSGAALTGVTLGSFGGSSGVLNYGADWLYAGYNDVNGDDVLTPWADSIPEPATLLLLALGAPLLCRRR